MNRRTQLIAATMVVAALAGCRSKGELVVDEGVGVTAVRSACPASGIPDYTGDITVFRPGGGTTAQDVDLVAAMTNLRTQCDDGLRNASGKVTATSTFDVLARRADARGARQVTIPYFVTVLRGGSAVVSKRIGQVVAQFRRRPGTRPGARERLGNDRPRRGDLVGRRPRPHHPQAPGRR